ncbi:MAG TPA: hypothetical protein VG759_17265, partial [Candidatus Angelobacter sp.]|nr:hypothetical protein [Candidatus Angelobacter sp.]
MLRSLGLDTSSIAAPERRHRDRLRIRIQSELMPYREVVGKPGAIPGLGPPPDDSIEWSVPIPWAALSIITEKIVRGCEYKIEGRFVEKPYGIR